MFRATIKRLLIEDQWDRFHDEQLAAIVSRRTPWQSTAVRQD
jgi:hypothetical protein